MFLRKWRLYHGTHVITCPENHAPAAVSVATFSAAPELHLRSCSRWPEMAGCDEACLAQIESAPRACALHTIVTEWYAGKQCHFCARDIGKIVWHERPPALRTPDGRMREWKDVAPQDLPVLFATAEPVCWTCSVVEEFRREHPAMVVERVRVVAKERALAPSSAVY
jgi:hypothetical protein